MVKKWQKQLDKFSSNFDIEQIIDDIIIGNTIEYDIIKLSGYKDLYRLRKGKIRIVFKKKLENLEILNIDTRGDVYKGM